MIHNSKLLIPLFVVFLLIGIFQSVSPMAGFYKLLKLIEFSFFGFYVARINLQKGMLKIIFLLAIGVLFESMLATAQFLKQGSLGGIFWFFGERTFSGQTPGLANASLDGKLILRSYGTFSHPNVLAAFLLIAMTLVVSSIKYLVLRMKKWVFVLSTTIGTIALLLTLSRVAIVLWLIILSYEIIIYLNKTRKNKKLFAFSFLLFTFVAIGVIVTSPLLSRFTSLLDVDKKSLIRRQELNSAAIAIVGESPLFGVGLNNFLVKLPVYQKPTAGPLWLQPVHNIYLLIASETGIVGLVFFLWFIWKSLDRIKKQESRRKGKKFLILSTVLALGFFDHYFLTLQQGQLLFALAFGAIWSKDT